MGATNAAALGPFKKYRPAATDEKRKNLLCVGCDFSGWYNFGKILKLLLPDVIV